jgi:hypothetical protein
VRGGAMKKVYADKLERLIGNFIHDGSSKFDDFADQYYYDELAEDMTRAAILVFDSSMKAQKFASEQ